MSRTNRLTRAATLLAGVVIAGCADSGRTTEPVPLEPSVPSAIVGGVRGTVDVEAGTLTFDPRPAAPSSMRTLGLTGIYADQGVTVRLYNSPVEVTVTTTTFQTDQIRQYEADSAQLWIDGTRCAVQVYSGFSAHLPVTPHGFYVGPAGTGANPTSVLGNSSNWDYIVYELGATQP